MFTVHSSRFRWEPHFALLRQQSSYPRRHTTCWASSYRSHIVSSMPCHGAWTSAPLSAHLSIEWECTATKIETPICFVFAAVQQLISSSDDNNRSAALWADQRWNTEWLENIRDSVLSFPTLAPTVMEWPCQEQRGPGPLLFTPIQYGPLCGLQVWHRRTDR